MYFLELKKIQKNTFLTFLERNLLKRQWKITK